MSCCRSSFFPARNRYLILLPAAISEPLLSGQRPGDNFDRLKVSKHLIVRRAFNLIAHLLIFSALIVASIAQGSEVVKYSLTYPPYHGHRFRVADCFVARPVWAFCGRFTAPRDQRVIVGEALQALAFNGRQFAHDRPYARRWVSLPGLSAARR